MTMSRNERGLSRRAFLGLGATAAMAAGAAGLAGCSPQASSDAASAGASDASAASGSTAAGGPSFLTGPSPIAESDIKETVEADIVIVGAGLSGISAARAAVESGAKNIVVVEKATTWQYRSNQVGCIGGKIQEDLGIHIDKNAAVGQIMKECGYRPNQRILNLWADNSGEAFDWFLAASEGQYVVEAESDTYDGKSMSVRKMHWPHPAEANIADDFYPIFDDCQICLPDNGPYIQNMVDICEKAGVQFLYSTFARQLVRPDNAGRVEGVIVEDENGDYKKITASKAVLLATGDYASNAEMMSYYVPWSDRFMSIFPNVDAKGEKTNTGDGQQMGMDVGGHLDVGPHAVMAHILQFGQEFFLQVNEHGERFTNEDLSMTNIAKVMQNQPGSKVFQIIDSHWPEQYPMLEMVMQNIRSYGDGEGFSAQADTLEELASQLELSADATQNLSAAVARYNELCEKGVDEDFGKAAEKMFPVVDPPFYAITYDMLKHTSVEDVSCMRLLVTMGGLVTDDNARVLDDDSNPIPGLFAVGNVQGGRFVEDYPFTLSGASHAAALTYGYLTGKYLAEQA